MKTSERNFDFTQLDVFTDRPLEGNQLAVFTDARGMSDVEMQALARETNLSETTFIIPADAAQERERGIRVRIFTTQEELQFAGHPTLGTAFYLHKERGIDLVELNLNVGKIPVRFFTDENCKTVGEMRQRDPEFGSVHNVADVAAALGVSVQELDESLPIQTVSTGMAFAIVSLRSLKTVQNLKFSWAQVAGYLAKTDAKFFYIVTRETIDPKATLHARMIFYNGEDPATGSAAGCCTAWAVKYGVFGNDQPAVIEQGIEMKRPSRILARASMNANKVTDIRIGGSVVEVSRGTVRLP